MEEDAYMTIGFIGQGFIGKNYADDFERRGFPVVRYALEEPYRTNKEKIALCDIVFVAVPTPTTPEGFDDRVIRGVLPLVGKGKSVVIKSTTLPGTVKSLQRDFPDIFVLHSPEFLAEKTAAYDAAHPKRNIVGIPDKNGTHEEKAREVLAVLPKAPYELVADSNETELIKYAGNVFLYFKLLYANLFYDMARSLGVDYEVVREAVGADPRIGYSHLQVIDSSGHSGATPGRGAGGHCLIKDFAALRMMHEKLSPQDVAGIALMRALEAKNSELLRASGKDVELLDAVYGIGA
jgi:UDPglucose 6-dehydrogenase